VARRKLSGEWQDQFSQDEGNFLLVMGLPVGHPLHPPPPLSTHPKLCCRRRGVLGNHAIYQCLQMLTDMSIGWIGVRCNFFLASKKPPLAGGCCAGGPGFPLGMDFDRLCMPQQAPPSLPVHIARCKDGLWQRYRNWRGQAVLEQDIGGATMLRWAGHCGALE